MLYNLNTMPDAYAKIKGSPQYPDISGNVYFYGMHGGTIVVAEIHGLPDIENTLSGGFFGFHIHEGSSCTGDETDPFKNAGEHFNPTGKEHPEHAGDLPPLRQNGEMAFQMVYTGEFYPEDVIGRTVVIHGKADDFKSQPSGDAGPRIACGVIEEYPIKE